MNTVNIAHFPTGKSEFSNTIFRGLPCPPLDHTPLITNWFNVGHFSLPSTSVDNVNVLMCGVTK